MLEVFLKYLVTLFIGPVCIYKIGALKLMEALFSHSNKAIGHFVFCLLSHCCTHLGFIFFHFDSIIFENLIAICHLYSSSIPFLGEFLSLNIPLLLFGGV
ncbi:hypothetical protein H1C71_034503 [Ictidomys tridecemlineatus]|nr:hypothetical protein H1C71_034503 [Ictidomys tridecemlineatus]KAG3267067.1 hypothetical protein H1C71_034503 [Ictidomys tridecemlineatus]KAG3267068.1 hypothetical protein H1C71_034503 [Ictidomys tridecemlineatus]KAG3267069.1 hypothetical protein H1C71_034503 [Ictidomys tridecemlineatus]KAG3267070.1 hypothetical protein H1C71_034503 [Ictidomys tridecemlineatus]